MYHTVKLGSLLLWLTVPVWNTRGIVTKALNLPMAPFSQTYSVHKVNNVHGQIFSLKVCSGRARRSLFFVCELCFLAENQPRSTVKQVIFFCLRHAKLADINDRRARPEQTFSDHPPWTNHCWERASNVGLLFFFCPLLYRTSFNKSIILWKTVYLRENKNITIITILASHGYQIFVQITTYIEFTRKWTPFATVKHLLNIIREYGPKYRKLNYLTGWASFSVKPTVGHTKVKEWTTK